MPDLVCNIAKGRVAELANRVDTNDPADSVLVVIPIARGAVTDAQLRDADTFAAMVTLGVTERTADGWERQILTDADLSALTPDDTNDRFPVDIPDQVWTPTEAGDTVTDLVVCYDPDSTGGADTALVPCVVLVFAVTPNGAPVTAQFTNDIFRAA